MASSQFLTTPPYLCTRIVEFLISGGDAWELISSLVNLPPFLICAGKKAVWEITFCQEALVNQPIQVK